MRKLIIPVQFIMVMVGFVFTSCAGQICRFNRQRHFSSPDLHFLKNAFSFFFYCLSYRVVRMLLKENVTPVALRF